MPKARRISPDPDDVQYFALALKLDASIWSNDKNLKNQNIVKVFSTDELVKILRM
jgi:predicted nucleic acid-binding protein